MTTDQSFSGHRRPQLDRSTLLRRFREMTHDGRPYHRRRCGHQALREMRGGRGHRLIVIYNSGRHRMAGRGSLAGLLANRNADEIVTEMAREVFPIARHTPVVTARTISPCWPPP